MTNITAAIRLKNKPNPLKTPMAATAVQIKSVKNKRVNIVC